MFPSGGGKDFEFKFYNVKGGNVDFYRKLIDVFCSHRYLYYCCFAVDKRHPRFDLATHFPSHWDAYINFSKLHIRYCCSTQESLVLLADQVTKPRKSTRYYEMELRRLRAVKNVTLMESHASLFIQLVDVLTGCVIGDLKGVGGYKGQLCQYLKGKYGVTDWASKTNLQRPNTFRVWHFIPR